MYTPYGPKMTLVVPGTLGGANWSRRFFDRSSGYLFVNANEWGPLERWNRRLLAHRSNIGGRPKW